MRPNLHKPVAGVGVIEPRQDHDLELLIIVGEMPFDAAAEIALPDVEHEAHRPEDMRFGELGRADGDCVEVPFVIWADRTMDPSAEGWEIEPRRAERPRIDAIGVALVDRQNETHPLIRRTRAYRPRRFGDADRLRRPFRMYVRRFWE